MWFAFDLNFPLYLPAPFGFRFILEPILLIFFSVEHCHPLSFLSCKPTSSKSGAYLWYRLIVNTLAKFMATLCRTDNFLDDPKRQTFMQSQWREWTKSEERKT